MSHETLPSGGGIEGEKASLSDLHKQIRANEHAKPDNLSSYIKRIDSAVAHSGFEDHEDVRSILKELLRDEVKKELEVLGSNLPERPEFDFVRAQINLRLKRLKGD